MKKFIFIFFLWHALWAFQSYQPVKADPLLEPWRWREINDLSGHGIVSLASDAKDNVWCGCDKGILFYDGMHSIWYTEEHGLNPDQLPAHQIIVRKDGSILAALASELYLFHNGKWYPLNFPFPIDPVNYPVIESSDGSLWIGSTRGLVQFKNDRYICYTDNSKKTYAKNETPTHTASAGEFSIGSIYQDNEDCLWVGLTNGTIYKTKVLNGEIVKFIKLPENKRRRNSGIYIPFYNMYQTVDKKLWIFSKQWTYGIDQWDPKTEFWDYIDLVDFGGMRVNLSMCQTKDESVWITGHSMISLYKNNQWKIYRSKDLGFPNAYFQVIPQNNDKMILMVRSIGVYVLDLSDKRWTMYDNLHFQCESSDQKQWFLDNVGNIISFDPLVDKWRKYTTQDGILSYPLAMFTSSMGTLWAIGSHHGTSATMRLEHDKWIIDSHPELQSFIDYRGFEVMEDSTLWFGCGSQTFRETNGGVKIFDESTGEWEYLQPPSVPQRAIGMTHNHADTLWFGGSFLANYSRKTKILNRDNVPNELQVDWIDDVHAASDGSLWASKGGVGLFRRKDGEWTLYTEKDGLAGNMVSALLETADGSMWAGTDAGISRFDGTAWMTWTMPENFVIPRESGFLRQSNDGAIWINLAPREWFFKEQEGVSQKETLFETQTIRFQYDDQPPETQITIFHDRVAQPGNTTIFWDGTDVWHDTPDEHLQFSYRLDNQEWSPFSGEKYQVLLKLGSGNHRFQVRARDYDFNIDPTPASVEFFVIPPIWKTPWFIISVLVTSFVIIVLVIRIYFQNQSLLAHSHELEVTNDELIRSKDAQEKALKAQLISDLNLVRMEAEKIHEIDQLKLKFFTNLSHEFRTPLTLILGPLKNLLDRGAKFSWPDFKNQFELMNRNAERLNDLIDQVLELRKLESGQLKLELSHGDIVHFIQDTLASFGVFAKEHHIHLNFYCHEKSISGWFDSDKVEKVLFNLLSNAFKFTPKGGTIRVNLAECSDDFIKQKELQPGPWIEIAVEDTGSGIPSEDLKHIFDRYFQASSNEKRFMGSGIGLAFTKELMQIQGGSIHVESKINVGTRFTLLLPLSYVENSESMKSADADDDHAPEFDPVLDKSKSDNPLILLIDDNPDMLMFVRGLLESEYTIQTAADGVSGLELARTIIPDLIVCDVLMPGKDGYAVCEELKSNELTSHIPVILLTAKSSKESRINGLQSGADAYIAKPFNIHMLINQVKNLLNSRRQLHEQFSKQIIIKPSDVVATSLDEEFLKKAIDLVEENLENSDFDTKTFVKQMGMSQPVLYRKLKSLTNLSISDFIRSIRIKRAHQLLSRGDQNITEICYQVGFNSLNYFISCFKKEYHITPKQFAGSVKQDLSAKTK